MTASSGLYLLPPSTVPEEEFLYTSDPISNPKNWRISRGKCRLQHSCQMRLTSCNPVYDVRSYMTSLFLSSVGRQGANFRILQRKISNRVDELFGVFRNRTPFRLGHGYIDLLLVMKKISCCHQWTDLRF